MKSTFLNSMFPFKETDDGITFAWAGQVQAGPNAPMIQDGKDSKEVNDALLELEKSGQAKKIYDHWFGPKSRAALPRDFKIGDKV